MHITDSGSSDRKVAFFHAYAALIDNFKALMTPYLSIVLEPLLSVLDAFVGESEEEESAEDPEPAGQEEADLVRTCHMWSS